MSNIKFLLDEDLSAKTLKRLRNAGFQVESVDSLRIKGTKNSDLLQFALSKQYVLITHDHDFLNPNLPPHFGILVVMIHPATDDVAGTELEKFLRAGRIDDLKKNSQIPSIMIFVKRPFFRASALPIAYSIHNQ